MITSKITVGVLAGVLLSMTAVSCRNSSEWKAEGSVEGGEGRTMLLQASTNGRWYTLDTVRIDNRGRFSVSQAPAGYPDIYRLNMDGRSVYFPVDSIETVTITTTSDGFDRDYTLSGSPVAEKLMEANEVLNEAVARLGAEGVLADKELKNKLNNMILSDPSGIVAYYIINRRIQGHPLYDPADRMDVRVIGAVANAFNDRRSRDPRTSYLKSLFLRNRNVTSGDTIHATEVPLFDINLYDEKGNMQSLAELASKGKVILLNFTVYGTENSPEFNRHLNKIYQRYHDAGMEIYQVAVDEDEFQWKQSARNLPWITVYNSSADGRKHLVNYNVTAVPTSFIINRKGEIAERVDDETRLDSRIKVYM